MFSHVISSLKNFCGTPYTNKLIMSGRGKGGRGLGKGGAKRHRKILRDNIQGITKPAIRRLARRGGVKRISGLFYEETRGVLKVFLETTIRDAIAYCEHAKRKTVSALDVVYALKLQGRTLYGFNGEGKKKRSNLPKQSPHHGGLKVSSTTAAAAPTTATAPTTTAAVPTTAAASTADEIINNKVNEEENTNNSGVYDVGADSPNERDEEINSRSLTEEEKDHITEALKNVDKMLTELEVMNNEIKSKANLPDMSNLFKGVEQNLQTIHSLVFQQNVHKSAFVVEYEQRNTKFDVLAKSYNNRLKEDLDDIKEDKSKYNLENSSYTNLIFIDGRISYTDVWTNDPELRAEWTLLRKWCDTETRIQQDAQPDNEATASETTMTVAADVAVDAAAAAAAAASVAVDAAKRVSANGKRRNSKPWGKGNRKHPTRKEKTIADQVDVINGKLVEFKNMINKFKNDVDNPLQMSNAHNDLKNLIANFENDTIDTNIFDTELLTLQPEFKTLVDLYNKKLTEHLNAVDTLKADYETGKSSNTLKAIDKQLMKAKPSTNDTSIIKRWAALRRWCNNNLNSNAFKQGGKDGQSAQQTSISAHSKTSNTGDVTKTRVDVGTTITAKERQTVIYKAARDAEAALNQVREEIRNKNLANAETHADIAFNAAAKIRELTPGEGYMRIFSTPIRAANGYANSANKEIAQAAERFAKDENTLMKTKIKEKKFNEADAHLSKIISMAKFAKTAAEKFKNNKNNKNNDANDAAENTADIEKKAQKIMDRIRKPANDAPDNNAAIAAAAAATAAATVAAQAADIAVAAAAATEDIDEAVADAKKASETKSSTYDEANTQADLAEKAAQTARKIADKNIGDLDMAEKATLAERYAGYAKSRAEALKQNTTQEKAPKRKFITNKATITGKNSA